MDSSFTPTDIFYEWEGTKFIAMLPFIWPSLVNRVKRWHDRNKSATWIFINVIPIIGSLWEMFELGFLPGTSGKNKYDIGYRDEERNLSCTECDFRVNFYDFQGDDMFCTECASPLEEDS